MIDDCSKSHTKQPAGYLAWHEWAEKMAATHEQSRCPTCGLWAIWTKKSHRVTPDTQRPASK